MAMSVSEQSALQASPSASPESSIVNQHTGNHTTRPPSASVDAAVFRSDTVSPSTPERPRALTAQYSQASPSASLASTHSISLRRPSLPSVVQRLSVSLQRTPVVAGVTHSFGARLAGSFSATPSVNGRQLPLHHSNASISRASRVSVMRADPTSQQRASSVRPQGITSPSHIPSSHGISHMPSKQANAHSRHSSTDHSQLQILTSAPTAVRVTAGSEDGPALPQQSAIVREASDPANNREASKSAVSQVSDPGSVSSRQSEVEQAAARLRSLDQEIMQQRKPSVVLHPISKRLSSLQREQQQQQREHDQQQRQRQMTDDERMRGTTIETPPTFHIALDTSELNNVTSPPSNHTQLTSHPEDDVLSPTDGSDPASSESATEAPPATGCGAVVAAGISSFIFSIVYLPFTVAILSQSVVQRRPILPINWQTELTPRYWLFAFSLFGFLFCFPFILVFGLLADTGIWSVFNNNVRSAIPFTFFFALYLSLFVMLHMATFRYAHIREDLSVIHSKTRQFHLTRSTMLCTAAIIFEAFQLISPFTSTASLGLHTSPAGSSDSGVESKYQGWLTGMAQVFGVGEWQVQDINTFLETFWIAFGIVIFYAFALGYGIQSNMQPSHMIAPVLFELIPGTFYLSIVGRLFRIFDCEPTDDGLYHLNGNTNVECWNNFYHRSMCMAAFMGLLFYSSSAMFVACYRGDASGGSGVKFKPVYLVLERTLRDLFAMTTSLIGNQLLSRAMSYPVLIVLTVATYRMSPCSIPTLTRLKVLAQASAVWLLTLSFLADMFRSVTDFFDVYVPGLLVWGWAAGVGLYLAYEAWCYWKRWKRRQQRRHTIALNGLAAVQGLQLADDDDDSEMEVAIQLGTRDSVHNAKETQILVEAAKQLDHGSGSPKPNTTVAITIDPAPDTPSTARGGNAVSAFTAPISTTPTSIMRNIRQQAIRHTRSAMANDGHRDSVSAQPNVVGRASVSGGDGL